MYNLVTQPNIVSMYDIFKFENKNQKKVITLDSKRVRL